MNTFATLRMLALSLSSLFLFTQLVVADITVQVGGSALVFTPSTVTAPVGTIVTFQISGRHSVTQSSFGAPCTHNGFNSAPLTTGQSFSINITDASRPIWFYCNVGQHCGSGMVGAINAPTTGQTFDAFHSAAIALRTTQPPQPDASVVVTEGIGASAVTAGSASSTGARSSTPAVVSAASTARVPATGTTAAGASQAASATSSATPSSGTTQQNGASLGQGGAILLGALAALAALI